LINISELGRAQFIPQSATSATSTIANVVLRFIAFGNWIAEVALRNCNKKIVVFYCAAEVEDKNVVASLRCACIANYFVFESL